jgi:hypothetical protein
MQGTIESYDSKTQAGVVKTETGSYDFNIDNWQEELLLPEAGDDVNFEIQDGKIDSISLVGAYLEQLEPVKSRVIAGVLGLVLGLVGAHRFYLGYYVIGTAQLIVTALTLGYGLLWGFVEGFLILSGNMNKDAKGRPLK